MRRKASRLGCALGVLVLLSLRGLVKSFPSIFPRLSNPLPIDGLDQLDSLIPVFTLKEKSLKESRRDRSLR